MLKQLQEGDHCLPNQLCKEAGLDRRKMLLPDRNRSSDRKVAITNKQLGSIGSTKAQLVSKAFTRSNWKRLLELAEENTAREFNIILFTISGLFWAQRTPAMWGLDRLAGPFWDIFPTSALVVHLLRARASHPRCRHAIVLTLECDAIALVLVRQVLAHGAGGIVRGENHECAGECGCDRRGSYTSRPRT